MNIENNSQNTEQKIIDAAKQVFLENGLEKAKMQDIANRAGISRTALNYYFRTKKNLFSVLIDQLLDGIIPAIEGLISTNISFVEKAKIIVDIYDVQLRQNDFIPRFVIVEVQRNPVTIHDFIRNSPRIQSYLSMMTETLKKEMEVGTIRTIPIEQIIAIFFSMVFTPYLLNPLVNEFFDRNEKNKKTFFDAQKENAKRLFSDFLKPDQP
ncbi:MAG: TetR/AcrR family transcriptional regulator [Bacteroidales bacterium]|nr:TetR/AcrR family transcriptional regulator [Bacteroidales bacterium]MDD2612690.1 TetR/AcrR family transcriptional regulator [Bacteroidales bacterium]MDD2613161.1 TetR/AcrR family transcriptional regulator [Bacteroidales bacterium]